MLYTYDDSFIVDSLEDSEIEEAEEHALLEVAKLNIEDEFYKEKLVISKVYMMLSLKQFENDGMNERYKAYLKEFSNYISLAKTNSSTSNISTIQLARG